MAKEVPNGDKFAVEWLKLSTVQLRNKTTNDPMLILKWNTNVAETSALAVPIFEEVSAATGLGSVKAIALKVGPLPTDKGTIAAVPMAEPAADCLPVRWTKNGTRASINLRKLFAVWPFEVPRGTTAQIPVSKTDLPGAGPCILFHFSKTNFQVIEEGKRSAKKKAAAQA